MNLLGIRVEVEDLLEEGMNPGAEDGPRLMETGLLLAALGERVKEALERTKSAIRESAAREGRTTFEVPDTGKVVVTFPGPTPKLRKGADLNVVRRTLSKEEFDAYFDTTYTPTDNILKAPKPIRDLLMKVAVEIDEGTPRVSFRYKD